MIDPRKLVSFDGHNLARARKVLAEPAKHPIFEIAWAKLVIQRLGNTGRAKTCQ